MFTQQSEKRCAIFLANGFEEVEALTVSDLLFRAGIPTALISVQEEPLAVSSHDLTVITDTTIREADLGAFDMLILPGGMPGTANLEACVPLQEALKAFSAAGKEVAAICAAPTILAHMGLLAGRKATCYPSLREDLIAGGAQALEDSVVTDGSFITSRGVGTAIDFALAIITALRGAEAAAAIAGSIVYSKA